VVSLAYGGRIVEDLGAHELTARLEAALAPGGESRPPGQPSSETPVADSSHA